MEKLLKESDSFGKYTPLLAIASRCDGEEQGDARRGVWGHDCQHLRQAEQSLQEILQAEHHWESSNLS